MSFPKKDYQIKCSYNEFIELIPILNKDIINEKPLEQLKNEDLWIEKDFIHGTPLNHFNYNYLFLDQKIILSSESDGRIIIGANSILENRKKFEEYMNNLQIINNYEIC